MNEKTFRVLEYNKIVDILHTLATTNMAKEIVSNLSPSIIPYEISEWQRETTEAASIILEKGSISLGSFFDTKNSLIKAQKGGCLNMKELLEILYNMKIARNTKSFLNVDFKNVTIITGLAELLFHNKKLEDDIDRCILSEDEMADNASSELRDLRRKKLKINEAIKTKMASIVASQTNRTMLQDSLYTIRDGRYVIPVKQEYKKNFPGIVHDQSSKGATLFIEPQVIVQLNNDLREVELKEILEIERILAELSARVAEYEIELLNNQDIITKLDFIFAKGKLSARYKSTEPEMVKDKFMKIIGGRHPLIDKNQVVPINITLTNDENTMVVTGPNTGGKTVTLKTVGLFQLMAQSGLHVPALEGTKLPIYNKIFADIGDEQSIEQSLSTFSSHMNNIVDIVGKADDRSLVLLDELGAGTDPTEGAALAISILEYLLQTRSKTMATTHYTELKKFALSKKGVVNASMQFDLETLSPTYKLLLGTPGKSNAFEIAKKLGLAEGIIDRARNFVSKDELQFEDVLLKIEEDRKLAEVQRDEAILFNLEAKKIREEIAKQRASLDSQKEKLISKAKEEARDIINETKVFADEVQKELKNLEKQMDISERNKANEGLRKRIKSESDKHREKLARVYNENPVDANQLKIGEKVKVLSLDQIGEIISLPDDKNEIIVQIGLLRVSAKLENISKTNSEMRKADAKGRFGDLYKSKAFTVSTSISVRGMNLDEAELEVDKYLDDAFIAGLKEVTIIHGRGEGILREGLKSMFKRNKNVDSFRKGNYNEGGDGVTVVYLK
ncbi:MAG: endonuclease MutS2 [Eubacteriales bacterium]